MRFDNSVEPRFIEVRMGRFFMPIKSVEDLGKKVLRIRRYTKVDYLYCELILSPGLNCAHIILDKHSKRYCVGGFFSVKTFNDEVLTCDDFIKMLKKAKNAQTEQLNA